MAHTIISNKKNTSAVIHFVSTNSSLIIAGNNSVSNVATSNEVLTGAYITQAIWGCDGNGHIQVYRGSNLVAVYDSTSQKDYAGAGMSLTVYNSANLDVKFVGSANSYLILEIQKQGTFTTEY